MTPGAPANTTTTMTNGSSNSNEKGSGIWYFGYGAMVNPISRARRGVETLNERPAVLEDFRLTFAFGGACNILRKRGWSVHGVLMECKAEKDWELLKEFDAGYDCIDVNVYPYHDSNNPVRAHIFVMDLDESENAKLPTEKLPQERYVRVIATGMRHHGVEDDYIEYSILNVPYIPNRKPEDYLTFPQESATNNKLKQISFNEYVKKSQKKVWFLIGDKVIQLGEHDPHSPFVEWIVSRLVGKQDCTWTMLQTLYDPDLPLCETEADIQPLHVAWTENQLAEKFEQADLTGTNVGFVKDNKASLLNSGGSRVGQALSNSFKKLSKSKRRQYGDDGAP